MNSFGAITLPIAAPGAGASVSDPALDVLLSFCKAVIDYEIGSAWGTRAAGETPPIRTLYPYNPEHDNFVTNDLPALAIFRDNGGTYEDDGIDLHRENSTLRVRWILPDTEQVKRSERHPILSGVSKALASAINLGRHPSWVVESDLADPDAVLLPIPTSLIEQTVTVFDGARADEALNAPRPISITTTASAAAYNTVDPIVVTMLLGDDREHVENIYLTNTNGGETVAGIWPAKLVTSVVFPAQLTVDGSLAVGLDESPEVTRGSLVKRFAGLSRLSVVGPGKRGTMPISVREGETIPYRTIDFELRIQEIFQFDMDASFDAFEDADDEGAGQGPLPVFIQITHPEPDGEVIEQAYFPDA